MDGPVVRLRGHLEHRSYRDVADFLQMAAEIPLKPEIQEFALHESNRALNEMKAKSIRGAKVLRMT